MKDWKPSSAALTMMALLIVVLPSTVYAGEVYGRVSQNGQIMASVTVTLSCPSLGSPRSVQTDRTGVFRLSGPAKEEKCTIKLGNTNAVSIFVSAGRSRVNLEVVNGTLIRR